MNNQIQQLNGRYRVMLVLWFAMASTVGIYFLLSLFLPRPEADNGQSRVITFVLTAMGIVMALSSILVRRKFTAQAEQQQQPALVQTGFIFAMALCEATTLLGLVDRVTTGNNYYLVLFTVGLIGMVLHFPRRRQLEVASYRQPNP